MDRQEFAARTQALRQRLYRTAYLYLGREADALEAVDEAVYQALRALKKLREPEHFDTWLTRILLNECSREKKRQDREQAVDQLPEQAWEDPDHLPLRAAVQALPEQLRAVILLRYFFDCTLRETAELLRMPRSTVHTREKKALKLLKLELSEEV